MASYLNLKPVEFDKLSAKRKAAVKWEGRILLPKYDGCLAIVYMAHGDLIKIVSRDNKLVRSMDHVAEALLLTYPRLAEMGLVAIIGEAWTPGTEFAVISGTYRRHSPQPQLGFAPFDIVKFNAEDSSLFSTAPYMSRLAFLEDGRRIFSGIYLPTRVYCDGEAHALRYARNLKGQGGYDGCIASDPAAPYVVSDGYGEFLKVKPIQTFSLKVVGVNAAVGEKTGRPTVSLVVRFKNGTCGVGTGFDNASAAAWAATPALIVGKIVEVGCMGVYPGDGMMREPRFLGIRDDVTTPDY